MKTSKNGIELIKKFEGCRLEAYRCPAGVLTIGYGHTKNVVVGQKITEAKAEAFLKDDLVASEIKVSKYDSVYHWNQNEFDAMVSFCFNIGNITSLTKFGKRSKSEVASMIRAYNKAGGKVLKGLVNRRQAEYDLFNTPVVNVVSGYQVGNTYKVVASGLNVRKEPTVNSDKVQKTALKKGTNIKVLDIIRDTDGNTWIKITKGYVAAIYKGATYVK